MKNDAPLTSVLRLRPVRALWLVALCAGSALIALSSLAYFDEGAFHPFVIEKRRLPFQQVWMAALYVHVTCAMVALPACVVLVLRTVMRRAPRVHRWLGRATGALILLGLVPSGAYLALFAKGGVAGALGFLVSAAITCVAMTKAIASARRKDFVAHRRFTVHVLAQLSVAVTSRLMLVGAFLRTRPAAAPC